MPYAVMVKASARKRIATDGRIWVSQEGCRCESYVRLKDRGVWENRREAEDAITEPYEIVVEIPPNPETGLSQ